ncbi:iron-containing alcohol dehydrogenase [Rhizobium sp. LC145]|uniref:iron-containing alcohol dehydrogenase n=1 Tax=Rhizobium sp. LC145 TaxID=1120688 RepID=UPI000629E8FF|nr:iron-containing alcohol dehydrogenase [Rhizobium sp. LC145]KKX33056.1 alcohol dehydrogenase [Rhizobium sp. LC145]TKT56000.1 iron-containing alcohol dehydrogenase [Rhizobiaceae bacterium LC148]
MTAISRPLEMLRPAMVRFGEGTIATLASWLAEKKISRPFIVSDTFNATRTDLLGISGATTFGKAMPEPDLPNLMEAVAAAQACAPDAVIGFGGGSAMDLAKLVAVLCGSGKSLHDISGLNRASPRRMALIQIPTTAGTGSEVGTRALITDPATMNKVATESPQMLADLAIIDPVLTMTVPPMITAATGIDAMAHCVEAFTSKRSHPLIDAYALEGIRLVGRYLPRAVRNGSDIEARAGLSLAAFYGGVCLGPVNTTAGHAISYPLGTRHKIAHGVANALIFPHVLAANHEAVPEKTALVCQALGFEANTAHDVLEGAQAFCKGFGLNMALSSHGVPESDLETMAKEAHAIRRLLDFNPRELAVSDILAIYRTAYRA